MSISTGFFLTLLTVSGYGVGGIVLKNKDHCLLIPSMSQSPDLRWLTSRQEVFLGSSVTADKEQLKVLKLGTVNTSGWMILGGQGCPVHCRLFSSVPACHELWCQKHPSSNPLLLCEIQNASQRPQMCPVENRCLGFSEVPQASLMMLLLRW